MVRIKPKRKSRFNKKTRRNTKKQRGRKIRELPPHQQPIPLPEVPLLALTPLQPLHRTSGTKTKKRRQKGGFKADEVDILEDRDDDWMITKQ